MNILILDMTHGGDILAEECIYNGHEVSCIDIYHLASEEQIWRLTDLGVKFPNETSRNYDLVMMPAHCPDRFLNDVTSTYKITFSRAVKELISDDRFRIEVTGVKGKTSLCYLLAHILSHSGMSVFLHTSRGEGPWVNGEHMIERITSIAPPSLLRIPQGYYDCIIAEVSLGGSGSADIAVITNLTEDYGIAENTKKASEAKAEVLTGGINIVCENEIEIWKRPTGSFRTYGNNIRIENEPRLGMPLHISFDHDGPHSAVLDGGYLSLQYIRSMDLAIEVCRAMNIGADDVAGALGTFRGVPGRGELSFSDNVWHITDRNPGVSAMSIRMTLSCLKKMDALSNAFVIVDPVNKKVCEKLDAEEVLRTAKEFGVTVHFKDGTYPIVAPHGTDVIITFAKEGYQ
ncbi:MAG: coenzyme F430 synthase [Methanomassiliicoccaceae archaeon]|nr:coenzyme F430 synthase [Methanomassiliicoccaceae archaeon]